MVHDMTQMAIRWHIISAWNGISHGIATRYCNTMACDMGIERHTTCELNSSRSRQHNTRFDFHDAMAHDMTNMTILTSRLAHRDGVSHDHGIATRYCNTMACDMGIERHATCELNSRSRHDNTRYGSTQWKTIWRSTIHLCIE